MPRAFQAAEPPCFHGKSVLWACRSVVPLCVRPGSGHPAACLMAEAAFACGVMAPSWWELPQLDASEGPSWDSDPGVFDS